MELTTDLEYRAQIVSFSCGAISNIKRFFKKGKSSIKNKCVCSCYLWGIERFERETIALMIGNLASFPLKPREKVYAA